MRFLRWTPFLLLALPLPFFDTACASDQVLTGNSDCGDGVQQPAEDCDVDSPGCVKCVEQTGWACRDNVCTEVCGDGLVVGTETCDPPDEKTCNKACHSQTAKPEACDMTGAWIVHQTDYSVPTVGVGGLQTSSNWYYLEITQTGSDFEVTRSIFCGITVSGAVDVKLADPAVRALMYRNRQDAMNPGGAHIGTFAVSGDGCAFEASRQYFVRGGKDSLLPPDFHENPDLATLTPLPSVKDLYAVPVVGDLDLAEDTDGDGFPGVAYLVTGLVSGTRNAVQRDWAHYQTDDTFTIAQHAAQFTARSDFRNQENILHVTTATGQKNALLEAGSTASLDTPGHVAFQYLGKTWNADPTQTIVTAAPGNDQDADFQTCLNIQAALPHEKGKK